MADTEELKAAMQGDIRDALKEAGVRRSRTRKSSLRVNKSELAQRVCDYYTDDQTERTDFIENRIQQYAKFRMWAERMDLPWADASDVPLPDMMSDSLRLQDTLHNAVMTMQPPVTADALNPEDAEKTETVDNLIQFQLFNDMDGEEFIGDMAQTFVNDGFYVVYTPWIKEKYKRVDVRVHDPIPDTALPVNYFQELLRFEYGPRSTQAQSTDADGWDWELPEKDEDPTKVKFYTRASDDKVEMVIEKVGEIFNGPHPRVIDIDDVLFPWRARNLQPPGPSNPDGASHVIIRDFPTIDELRRLHDNKYYDQIRKSDLEKFDNITESRTWDRMKTQKDDLQGTHYIEGRRKKAKSHNQLTRLICFDRYDIDGDGLDEDIIVWVIEETKTVLRVKLLSEVFPATPPLIRPLISESMIPVKGRVIGISLLEMKEGLHDIMKELIDQTIDAGTLASSPFFFYKPSSSLNPEIMSLAPGEGVPVGNPKEDVFVPNFQNASQAFGINMLTLLGEMSDQLTMISDLQQGQIPAGKATALRTEGGIRAILSQGEARPERVLRRFFKGLTKVYRIIHEMNQRMLPDNKKIKVTVNMDPAKDPYQTISDKTEIRGKFQFKFSANILNTSKAAMQQALDRMLNLAMSEVAMQMGITGPDGVYRLIRDIAKAYGQDPNAYFNKPSPMSDLQPITAEQAMVTILNGAMPGGIPIGGWVQHLNELSAYMKDPSFAALTDSHLTLFNQYMQIAQANAQREQQQQRQIEAARAFQQQQGQQPGGGGQQAAQSPDMGRQQLSNNEFIDERMR